MGYSESFGVFLIVLWSPGYSSAGHPGVCTILEANYMHSKVITRNIQDGLSGARPPHLLLPRSEQ
jgi:hypothetical protein